MIMRFIYRLFGLCDRCGGSGAVDIHYGSKLQPCPKCNPGVPVEARRRIKEVIDALSSKPEQDEMFVYAHPNQYNDYCEWFGRERVKLIQPLPVVRNFSVVA